MMEKISFGEKIPLSVMELMDQLSREGHAVYIVGGAVRDLLLSRPVIDWDLAGDDNFAAAALSIWKKKNLPCYMLEGRHRFARLLSNEGWYIDAQPMEGSLEEDISRRDFTVNAMLWNPVTKELHDSHNGMKDLKEGILRAISGANLENDPLRLLRGVRLEGRLRFRLEPGTQDMIRERAGLLFNAAPERIRDELFKILDLPDSASVLKRADEMALLLELFPRLSEAKGVTQNEFHRHDVFDHSFAALTEIEKILKEGPSNHPGIDNEETEKILEEEMVPGRKRASLLKLGTFLHDVGKPETKDVKGDKVTFYGHQTAGSDIITKTASRLLLSAGEANYLSILVEQHMRPILLSGLSSVSNRARYRLFRDAGSYMPDLILLTLADMAAGGGPASTLAMHKKHEELCHELLSEYYEESRIVKPPRYLDGHRIMEILDIEAGPLVGKVLADLEEATAMGTVNSKQEAEAFVIEKFSN